MTRKIFRKTKVLLCWGSYKTETKHFLGFFFLIWVLTLMDKRAADTLNKKHRRWQRSARDGKWLVLLKPSNNLTSPLRDSPLPLRIFALALFLRDACRVVCVGYSHFPSLLYDTGSSWQRPFMLPTNMRVNLWTRSPSGQNGGCRVPEASTRFNLHDLLLFAASGLCAHMICHGLWPPLNPWVLAHAARGPGPESPDPAMQPGICLVQRSPWPPPAWTHKAELDCTANTLKRLFKASIHLPNGVISHGVNWM